MFERYNERARRVIFFARYEASQYGSQSIETEYLLLGLLREARELIHHFTKDPDVSSKIREEIERRIARAKPISTTVEIPLSLNSKKALTLAAEIAENLGHRLIDPGHLLAGLLLVDASMAAQLLRERGMKASAVHEQLAKTPLGGSDLPTRLGPSHFRSFLVCLKSSRPDELLQFFAKNAKFIDAAGKLWNRQELEKSFDTLLAPYAKRNAKYGIESTLANTRGTFIATVLWRNALLDSAQHGWLQRMTVALVPNDGGDWDIVSIQVTAVQPGQAARKVEGT